jgi:glutathione S-transferase
MVLTLHGYSGSTATHRVRIVLNEKNVPFSFVEVDLAKREQNHPDYVAKHPFGVVPYIVRVLGISVSVI